MYGDLQLQKDGSWATWVNLAFERMDGNSDGFISLEELVELLPQDTVDDERLLEVGFQVWGGCM